MCAEHCQSIEAKVFIKHHNLLLNLQCAVRAAVHGRILILDGVEHAERNVLPILNNLLENREMHLENGKFLMSPERYDKLLQTYSKEELDKWGLLRVSEDFRVIALGLPTQKYKGTPLDPPLRSRFQSRNVSHYSYSVSDPCIYYVRARLINIPTGGASRIA